MQGGSGKEARLVIADERDEAGIRVRLEGELDISTAPKLERALEELAEIPAGYLILDLKGLDFCDAAGLRVIERAGRRLGTRLIVCGPRPSVRKIIAVTRLDEQVRVEEGANRDSSDIPASNLAYVQQLWDAYAKGGPERFASLLPDGVEWRSLWGDGQILRGTEELLDFWRGRPRPKLTPDSLTAIGDDVLVTWRGEDASPKQFWSLYRFAGRQLVEAVSFDREAEAIAALDLMRGR
jgi:anti-sigma B factor antagonist